MSNKALFRIVVHAAWVLALLVTACTPAATSRSRQVLMILSETSRNMNFMLTNEVGVMKDMLTQAGFTVVTASDSGQRLGGMNKELKPDLKISDVKVADYVGVIIPCMARMQIDVSPEKQAFIKDAVAQGKVIAAQLGGIDDLYRSGVLNGKQIAYNIDSSVDLPKAIYKGDGVVQDGKIITGGVCPYIAEETGQMDTTAELTQKFIEVLNAQ